MGLASVVHNGVQTPLNHGFLRRVRVSHSKTSTLHFLHRPISSFSSGILYLSPPNSPFYYFLITSLPLIAFFFVFVVAVYHLHRPLRLPLPCSKPIRQVHPFHASGHSLHFLPMLTVPFLSNYSLMKYVFSPWA